jgi:hypothetical protein
MDKYPDIDETLPGETPLPPDKIAPIYYLTIQGGQNVFGDMSQVNNIAPGVDMSDKVKIEISGGTIGFLNAGEIHHVEAINANVQALAGADQQDIAKGLKELTEAFSASEELSNEQREEALQLLDSISAQAASTPEKRLPTGAIKAMIAGFGTIAGGAGGLAKVWDTWGQPIRHFFGI